jgi:surfactin synthase thioesterase subunit
MQLFCFHCAGGSSNMFSKWEFPGIDVVGIDLPGRGIRVNEPFLNQFDKAVEDLANKVISLRNRSETWGVFGHSMGGLLAYEVSRRLQEYKVQCRILSGINPIDRYGGGVKLLDEDDHTIVGRLADLGGVPNEYKNHPMFVKWFAPILRADLSLVKTFRYTATKSKIPTYIVNGLDDILTRKAGEEDWKEVMPESMEYVTVEGGHFSILQKPEVVDRLVKASFKKLGVTSC